MLVYIAGPVSNMPNYNREAFMDADEALARHGFRVCNPAFIGDEVFRHFEKVNRDPTWADFMRACVPKLAGCDCVLMLEGWEKSKGAKWEMIIAKYCFGMPVFLSMGDLISWSITDEKIAV